jgi:hypothetical protein
MVIIGCWVRASKGLARMWKEKEPRVARLAFILP